MNYTTLHLNLNHVLRMQSNISLPLLQHIYLAQSPDLESETSSCCWGFKMKGMYACRMALALSKVQVDKTYIARSSFNILRECHKLIRNCLFQCVVSVLH